MKLLTRPLFLVFYLLLSPIQLVTAASDSSSKPKPSQKPCTIRSPTTGSYFDLNAISLSPPEMKDGQKAHKDDRTESWRARGHDYPGNFTLNICAPVIEDVEDVVGVDKSRWRNVSAFYELNGKTYSIGEQSSTPIFRGRKLVLNYTNGSPCPSKSSSLLGRALSDDYDDYDDYKTTETSSDAKDTRTKSTVMSFLCDRDGPSSQATVSFVGTMDSCTYFFEVRSPVACGGVAAAPGAGLGPGGVFGVIVLIAVAVYLIGGCAYQRTVMHQRGWRQCPNYSMWAGLVSFVSDFVIIIFSSLTRCFVRNRGSSSTGGGYSRANGPSPSNQRGGLIGAIGGRGRGGEDLRGSRTDVDAENRLIDQLDEEWEE